MSVMTVFTLCERAIGLVRGKRLILNADELTTLLNLNYSTLTSLHAQDEAIVCVLHFEQVRDRLLQLYPWVFARRRKTYGTFLPNESRELPEKFLTMLCVKKDGRPIEYEQSVNLVIPDEADEIIYTYKVEDVKQWPPIFCDVFCYALAVEICSAVTGKPEYIQLLEQKEQEMIQRAYQIGAIKADVPVTLKEEMYNRAIALAHGQRTLKPESNAAYEQGIDNYGELNTRRREEIAACERASESVRDRLFELYAWKFARKSANLNTSSGNIQGWEHDYILPEDCVKVLSLISDGEPAEYEECRGEIYCNAYCPTVRYTACITDMEKWPGIFRDVYVCNLAQEIILATTHNLESVQLLETKAQSLIRDAIRTGAIRGETEIPQSEELFRRAISLSHGTRAIKPTGNASVEQGIDVTGDINYYAREEILICKRSYEYHRDSLLKMYGWRFARKTAILTSTSKISGWKYAYVIPSDCLKVLCVLSGDEPVEYEESDGKILCDAVNVSVRYTRSVSEIKDFDSVFREVLCCRLAVEIITGTRYNGELIQILEQRVQTLIREGYRTGVIHEEQKIPLKDELCERAVKLAYGTRSISPVSETGITNGIDNAGILNDRYTEGIRAARLSYENVRDKLLESYAWTFAKKKALITGGILPSDCVNVLTAIKDGEAVEYEIASGKLSVSECEIVYVSKITEMSSSSAIFREVFCYSLAIEILRSTTGNEQAVQSIESSMKELIRRAQETGAIKSETRITLKEELYNRAIKLSRGHRTLNPSGEQTNQQGYENVGNPNWRTESEHEICRLSSDSIRDKLLSLYAWTFAKRSITPQRTSTSSGWTYAYELPSDCLTVLTVLDSGEASDYEVSDGKVYSNAENAEVRYTARISEMSDWAGAFRDAFCYGLAEEICASSFGASELITQLEQRLQQIITEAYKTGVIKTETRIPMKRELFNRAIGLVKGMKTEKPDILDTRYQDEVSACYRSYETLRDRLLQLYEWVFARKTEIPAQLSESVPGWKYTYMLPEDCLKVLSVIAEDKRVGYGQESNCRSVSELSGKVEILDYETAGSELYANHAPVYVRYTARITNESEWAVSYKDALVILMAIEICHNVTEGLKLIQILEQRLQGIIENARASGVIRPETRLPLLRDSRYRGAREVPYLDYSGLPTVPCSPLDYCCGGLYERVSSEFCVR